MSDPDYGIIRYPDGRTEQCTCLEPECKRGPCTEPDVHVRQWDERSVGYEHMKPREWIEQRAARTGPFPKLCRTCQHWRHESISWSSGGCRLQHPANVEGRAVWPCTQHDDACGEWTGNRRVMQVVKRQEEKL